MKLLDKIERSGRALKFKNWKIPFHLINVLPQPRKTFECIPELALDIVKKGLLNPITIACFDKKNCREYLRTINSLWGTNFKVKELKVFKRKRRRIYFVLLAGERRLRACRLLWEEGCEDCREKYGKEPAGKCFERHFKSDKIEVRCCFNISPFLALFLQFSENTYTPLPPHEEAHAYTLLFRLIKKIKPDFSLAAFAREVGRSPETIRRAKWYCELPMEIQKAVEEKIISYSIAVELARLQQHGLGKEELFWWLSRVTLENLKASEFKEKVNIYLQEHSLKQSHPPLWDIFRQEQEKMARRLYLKKIVEKNVINVFWCWTHYFKRVMQCLEKGWLKKRDSPFSLGSPLRAFHETLETLERLLPHLKELISEKKYFKAEETIANCRNMAMLLSSKKSTT